jgi:hypothetical protein
MRIKEFITKAQKNENTKNLNKSQDAVFLYNEILIFSQLVGRKGPRVQGFEGSSDIRWDARKL